MPAPLGSVDYIEEDFLTAQPLCIVQYPLPIKVAVNFAFGLLYPVHLPYNVLKHRITAELRRLELLDLLIAEIPVLTIRPVIFGVKYFQPINTTKNGIQTM